MLKATIGSLQRTQPERTTTSDAKQPSWIQRQIVPYIQAVSRRACTHPIHTLVFVALIASTTYIGLLESPLFEPPATTDTAAGPVDFSSLLGGSKTLHIGADTAWKWQNGERAVESPREKVGIPVFE